MSTLLESSLLTRKQIAPRCGLSLRTLDELLAQGMLPHFRFGKKAIRFDLAEVEAALRERFHVNAKARKPTKGRA